MPFSIDEYRAVRERAGLIDRADRGTIAVAGADRKSFLQGLLTNDIAALTPGTGCYAAYLTPHGRMITDMRVLDLGEQILLEVPSSLTANLVSKLEELVFTEDVQIADWSGTWALIGVHGPHSATRLAAALAPSAAADEPVPTVDLLTRLHEHENRRWAFGADAAIVVRTDDYATMGFEVCVKESAKREFRSALEAAGVREVGRDTAEALRVEAGRPAFGIDMDEETIPLEAGIEDRAISFTKGCYVGQELIVRIMHRGHGRIARKLVGLTIEAPVDSAQAIGRVVAAGDPVLADEGAAGRVTSAAFSPTLDRAIALGYVPRQASDPGTRVTVDHEGRQSAAVVTKVPFVGKWVE